MTVFNNSYLKDKDVIEKLTFLYLENQNLKGLAPAEITAKYLKAREEIQTIFDKSHDKDSNFSYE